MLIADTSNFLVPNATFIVELVLFIVILGTVTRFVLPPLTRVMQQRRDRIREGLEQAEQAHQLDLQARAEYQAKLEEARRAARAAVEESTRAGEQLRDEMRKRARAEYDALVSEAQERISEEVERASAELRRRLEDLVLGTTRKVLDREPPPEIHRAVADETAGDIRSSA